MINCAVVGLGWWGQTLVRTLKESNKVRVKWGVDLSGAAAETARDLGIRFTVSLDDVLADPATDAVLLCTPHTLHCDQIIQVARARKHVFCEKPLSLTKNDAERAIKACADQHVVLGVGHEKRFEPPITELRRIVEAGELGVLLQVEANFSQDKFLSLPSNNWRLSSHEAPAGPMTATGIHLLDLAVSFLGPAERVLANVKQLASPLQNGDTLGAMVNFKSGANALISAILSTSFDGRFAIYGSEGWAEVRDKAHPEESKGWILTFSSRRSGIKITEFEPADAVRINIENFVDAIEGRAPYPYPQEQMLQTIAALEAVFASAISHRVELVNL